MSLLPIFFFQNALLSCPSQSCHRIACGRIEDPGGDKDWKYQARCRGDGGPLPRTSQSGRLNNFPGLFHDVLDVSYSSSNWIK